MLYNASCPFLFSQLLFILSLYEIYQHTNVATYPQDEEEKDIEEEKQDLIIEMSMRKNIAKLMGKPMKNVQ